MSTLSVDRMMPLAGVLAKSTEPIIADADLDAIERRERLLASVASIQLPPKIIPPAYRLTMGLLAGSLVLLPIVYLALTLFLAWLIVWHVTQAIVSLDLGPYFVFHVPMALLGLLLFLFLVKPIFFRQKSQDQDVLTLRPEEEPALFEFVRRLCLASGARMPASIEVDCDPNASARIKGGFWSVFGGKLVLRLGLPLVSTLSVRQFAGLIGHELGHFNQRSGMTGSYLVRRLTGFFATVVFRRDKLDEKLASLRYSNNGFANLAYWLAVAFLEPMRGLLWLVMLLSHLLSCSVLRRMEYDADRLEANLAGVDDFISTSKLLVFLNIASQRAKQDLSDSLDRKRLADDVPALVAANARQLAEFRDDILKHIEAEKTSWFDTHPSHSDRAASVQMTGSTGLIDSAEPAPSLFANFGGLCQRATQAFYADALGAERWQKMQPETRLVATAEIASERLSHRQAAKSLTRFFRNQMVASRPIFPMLDAANVPDDSATIIEHLREARREMTQLAETMGPVVDQYDEAVGTLPGARAQLELCGVFAFNPKANKLRKSARDLERLHEPLLINASRQLAAFEDPARRRLTAALQLLGDPAIAGRLPGTFDADGAPLPAIDPLPQVRSLVAVCDELHGVLPKINSLRESMIKLQVLYAAYNSDQPYQPLVNKIIATDNTVIDLLREVRADLDKHPYPYLHGAEGCSVGAALVDDIPKNDDPAEAHGCAGKTVDKYFTLVFRALSTLTEWAEKAETAAGLEPLAEPPDREGKQELKEKADAKRDGRKYWLTFGARSVAGIALVAAMVWYSVSPPELPEMLWAKGSRTEDRWRPASFDGSRSSYRSYQPTPPTYYPQGYSPDPSYSRYNPGNPSQPGGYQPNGYQPGGPGSPGYPYPGNQPNSSPQPYQPYQAPRAPSYNPRPSNPGGGYQPGGGGGYRPGGGGGYSPGGGGYSPGGGGRPGR